MDDYLNNLSLPSSNSMEDLETISRNKLTLLFSPALFELRPEVNRDKGIDFIIEIKKNDAYTNFRFAVQLKSTSTIKPNKDGSISFPIEISNINYLLNYGMPAYYILYNHTTDEFYAETANNIYSQLQNKYSTGGFPKRFGVKFSTFLSPKLITEIYKNTLNHGILLRKLTSHVKFSIDGSEEEVIVIDRGSQVYSVDENIAYIDKYGPMLINNFQFKQIIEAEQKAHPRSSVSHTFNLVCGMAYFQRGNLFKAMEFLKSAEKQRDNFDSDEQAVLFYTLLNSKYLLGIISKENYDKEMGKIIDSENSGTFFAIDKAYDVLSKGGVKSDIAIKVFYDVMAEIIKKEKNNIQAIVKAYAKVLDAESVILFHDLKLNFVYFIGRVQEPLQSKTYKQWLEFEVLYFKRMDALISFAAKNNYFLGVLNLSSARINWIYKKIFYRHLISHYKNDAFDLAIPLSSEDFSELDFYCKKLDKMAHSYEMLEHIENKIYCLLNKFEILLFMGLHEEVLVTKRKILQIIETNDMEGLKAQYSYKLNGNTQHEIFIREYIMHLDRIRNVKLSVGLDTSIPFSKDELALVEKSTKWSIESFLKFRLPDIAP